MELNDAARAAIDNGHGAFGQARQLATRVVIGWLER